MTSTDLVPHAAGALAVNGGQTAWTPEQEAALRQIGLDGAPAAEATVFLHYCQRTQLDPFARQIYMIGRNASDGHGGWTKKWTIQASIDGLRIVAQRSGDYDGQEGPEWCGADGVWRDVWTSDEPPVAARVWIRRRSFSKPVPGLALYREYVQTNRDGKPTQMWRDKPAGQLAKCAEALGLRKAFPHDLAGVYTEEEMARADAPQEPPTRAPNRPGASIREAAEAARQPAAPETDATGQPYADAEVVDSGELIDGDRLREVNAALSKAGYTTMPKRLAFMREVTGRDDIEGTKDLTTTQAAAVLAALESPADAGEVSGSATSDEGQEPDTPVDPEVADLTLKITAAAEARGMNVAALQALVAERYDGKALRDLDLSDLSDLLDHITTEPSS